MGDVGSTFLGLRSPRFRFSLLRYATRNTQYAIGDSRFFITGILFVAPFVFDTALILLRRAIHRENILQPHRSHLYQRLMELGA
ncbi:MAG: hypothetical protein HY327_06965 [Chloroflexi bacterium]|nr:hypothetical protein [Chloroflexota bacterium]